MMERTSLPDIRISTDAIGISVKDRESALRNNTMPAYSGKMAVHPSANEGMAVPGAGKRTEKTGEAKVSHRFEYVVEHL
jgi:hypothetical protein